MNICAYKDTPNNNADVQDLRNEAANVKIWPFLKTQTNTVCSM